MILKTLLILAILAGIVYCITCLVHAIKHENPRKSEIIGAYRIYVIIYSNKDGISDRFQIEAKSAPHAIEKFRCDTGLTMADIISIRDTD